MAPAQSSSSKRHCRTWLGAWSSLPYITHIKRGSLHRYMLYGDLEKNVPPWIYLARAPLCFGALVRLFTCLFRPFPCHPSYTSEVRGGQSDNSKFWLNIPTIKAATANAHSKKKIGGKKSRNVASKSSSHHSLTQRNNASELEDWIVANWTSFGESGGEFISMSAIRASGDIAAARKDRDVSSMRLLLTRHRATGRAGCFS